MTRTRRNIQQDAIGLEINFNPPVVVNSMGGVNITTNKVTIIEMVDNPIKKNVTVTAANNKSYVLWSGDAYTTIGQWTDQNVIDRLRELLISGSYH